jgi:nicotinate phosphoribosyltransferase
MVQLFMALGEGEIGAFRAFAEVYPDDCLLLVDTIDTLTSGIPNAIRVFEELRRKGHEPVGIRLDSGDLAYLSIQAARMLDDAGFPDTRIVLSNQLDEVTLWQITSQIEGEAPRYGVDADHLIRRLVYGVGTNLITSQGAAALDGVYKLVAVDMDGEWVPAIKISENPAKIPNPGFKGVWRLYDERGKATADLLTLDEEEPRQQEPLLLRHPAEPSVWRRLHQEEISDVRDGELLYDPPSIEEIRARRQQDLKRLDPGVRRIIHPHAYHVSLTQGLWQAKQDLIESLEQEE